MVTISVVMPSGSPVSKVFHMVFAPPRTGRTSCPRVSLAGRRCVADVRARAVPYDATSAGRELALHVLLAKHELLDLARAGQWEGIDEHPRPGRLVRGQAFADVRGQLGRRRAGTFGETDERRDLLAPPVVRHSHDRDIG